MGPPLAAAAHSVPWRLCHTLEHEVYPGLRAPRAARTLARWGDTAFAAPGSAACVTQSGCEEDRRDATALPGRSAVPGSDAARVRFLARTGRLVRATRSFAPPARRPRRRPPTIRITAIRSQRTTRPPGRLARNARSPVRAWVDAWLSGRSARSKHALPGTAGERPWPHPPRHETRRRASRPSRTSEDGRWRPPPAARRCRIPPFRRPYSAGSETRISKL
jgi:hypothetical protein